MQAKYAVFIEPVSSQHFHGECSVYGPFPYLSDFVYSKCPQMVCYVLYYLSSYSWQANQLLSSWGLTMGMSFCLSTLWTLSKKEILEKEWIHLRSVPHLPHPNGTTWLFNIVSFQLPCPPHPTPTSSHHLKAPICHCHNVCGSHG